VQRAVIVDQLRRVKKPRGKGRRKKRRLDMVEPPFARMAVDRSRRR